MRLTGEADGETRIDADESRMPMTPLAVAMVLGMLLGALGVYAFLSRRDSRDAISTEATQQATPAPPDQRAAAPAPPPQKEFSEQAVTQPPAKTPPSARPPDVPADAPGRTGTPATAAKPSTPAPAPPAAPTVPTAGRLIVRSTPDGANVTVNGRWRGRTPLTLEKLDFGNYVVRIVAPGYQVYREDVRLSSSEASRTISERLERSAPSTRATPADTTTRPTPPLAPVVFLGSVYVDSRPRGAKVFIDGKEVGTTPLKMPEISIGAHVVRLELKDHHTWTSSVRIAAGEEQRVTGSLEPIR